MDPAVVSTTPSTLPARSAAYLWLRRIAVLALVAAIGFFSGRAGLRFRHWMWDTTVPIRFVSDINRGYQWGRTCATEGYLNQYEKMQFQKPTDDDWLDYGPLRLGVMALWGKWALVHYPHVRNWYRNHSYELTAPVLQFNLFMEAVGLISAFFLTRLWAIRGNSSPPRDGASIRYFFRGCLPGLIAVLLLWFNPSIVLSAYGWPTWDLWIIPMFLLAALLASVDWWFTAGVVIGIGAMFKGQQLLAVPVFAIWSLLVFRPLNTLKFLGGVVISIALVTSPWLLTYIPAEQLAQAHKLQSDNGQAYEAPMGTFNLARTFDLPALFWVVGILLGTSILPFVGWLRPRDCFKIPSRSLRYAEEPDRTSKNPALRRTSETGLVGSKEVTNQLLNNPATKERWRRMLAAPWTWRTIAALTAFALFVWPWVLKRNRGDWEIGYPAACVLAASILLIRPRGIAYLTATATGVALLLCISVFHGSHAWYDCGLHFGTIHWPKMTTGMTDNLPGILVNDFNWPLEPMAEHLFIIPAHSLWVFPACDTDVSMRGLLQSIFVITLIPCCLGVGMHAGRRDPRILIALTAPWLMFFCFPAQIHERYLLYAAGISCICAGVSAGMTLLGIFLSIVTFIMTLDVMLACAGEGERNQFGHNLAMQFPAIFKDNAGEKIRAIANGTYPDLGYAVLLCGLIFLYFSLAIRQTKTTIFPQKTGKGVLRAWRNRSA